MSQFVGMLWMLQLLFRLRMYRVVLKATEFVSYVKFSLNQTKRLYRCSMRIDSLSECENIGV